VRAAGSGWIVKDRTPGRRGFRRSRDESNPVEDGTRLNGRIFSPTGARRHCPGFKGARRWGAGRQAGSGNSAGGVGALRRAAPGSAPPPPPNPPPSRLCAAVRLGRDDKWAPTPLSASVGGGAKSSPIGGGGPRLRGGGGRPQTRYLTRAMVRLAQAPRSLVSPLRHGAKPRRATSPDGGGFAAPELHVILVSCIRKKPP
jgi:hypothetical protein